MPANPKLLELRPDRALLNADFAGYRLTLHDIPKSTKQLRCPVDKLDPSPNQYSLLHAKLFGLHNHLTGEMQERYEGVFFVDSDWIVREFRYGEDLMEVWEIPSLKRRELGDYNVSLKLVSELIALIADGVGTFYILQRAPCTWHVEFSGEIAGPDQNFIIIDGVLKNKTELHVLLLSIRHIKESERFCSILHWMTLTMTDSWNQVALRELVVPGYVQLAFFEQSCLALYVISDSGCKFTLDSENEITVTPPSETEKKYTWTQNAEALKIKVFHKGDLLKDLVQIIIESKSILVKFGNEVQLEGDLSHAVNSNLMTWSFESDFVEIVLQKSEPTVMWSELIPGNCNGEYVVDTAIAEEIAERLSSLTSDSEEAPPLGTTFNSQQVEECDFAFDKLTIFERIDRDSHRITDRVNLGSYELLLTVNLPKQSSPCFAVRSDVDACIWQPNIDNGNFKLEHKGTLMAMGYIQASKQEMRYFVCSPNLSFSAVCGTTHALIYCQHKPINVTHNRATGRRVDTLAQQLVYRLPSESEVVGLYASNTYLYILGVNFITALKI